jgi:predicted small metal-binding protein
MARGDTRVADEILADDYVDHDIPGPFPPDRHGLKQAVLAVRSSFPDAAPGLFEVVAERDLVAVRVEARGTHTGDPFMGVPHAGASIRWKEIPHLPVSRWTHRGVGRSTGRRRPSWPRCRTRAFRFTGSRSPACKRSPRRGLHSAPALRLSWDRLGREDSMLMEVTCRCGWQCRGTENEVIDQVQAHGRSAHGVETTSDEIKAIWRPVEDGTVSGV